MALRPCSDLSAADWIASSDLPWDQLVTFGPQGFSAYARLRLIPDVRVWRFSTCLDVQTGTTRPGPQIAPAFPPSVLHGPKVVVPNRAYFLFHGKISELGDWDAAENRPDQPRSDMPDPAFIWPADHAWCIANDVDPHWIGIGADTPAIDQLLAHPLLDVVPADPRQEQPRYQ